jgi:membrane protein implicated in regulation of membrane protease activity
VGLTSIWFAAGALVALVAALVNGPIWLQVALFLVVSVLCLIAVRPLAKKYLNPVLQPTNADRILGAEVRVTEEIDNLRGQGQVAVGAMPWTARSEDGAPIPAGALVRVLRIEGVKVYVEPVKEEVGAAK